MALRSSRPPFAGSPPVPEPSEHTRRRRFGKVWQALGIYLAASWGALQVVDTLVDAGGLPDFLPGLALVLLVIGFPIVLATSFLQSGAKLGSEAGEGAKEPARMPTPPVVERVLTWRNALVGALGATLLWGAVAAAWIFGMGGDPEAPGRRVVRSVAVLPFVDLSQSQDQEYFGDGLAEEILHTLAAIPDLRVPARTSSFAFKGQNIDVREIGDRLGVDAVLEGSVRKQGDEVRITAQLIDVEDGFHRWSRTIDGRLENVFDLQEEVSRSVAAALEVQLGVADAVEDPGRSSAPDGVAFDLVLQARHQWNERTPSSMRSAIALFEEALKVDPLYADAYVGLADVYNLQALNIYTVPRDSYARGIHSARRALELEPGNAGAYAALGLALFQYERKWIEAENAFRESIRLDPRNADARYFYSMYLSAVGRRQEAVQQAREAWALDPASPPVGMGVGMALYNARRFEDAIAAMEEVVTLAPDYFFPYSWLGINHAALGEWGEAEEAARHGVELNPQSPLTRSFLAEILAMEGRVDEARPILDELEALWETGPVSATYIARVYAAMGDG
ncbi:MAG: tetratricopeptide repeat protein, partial [Gemmatimonadota bacterium]|nr:tetratricopeptide repeat protein [Gemmatimonadota bacterium]